MSPKLQDEKDTDQGEVEFPHMNLAISTHVMHALGRPDDLHRVQVRRLWTDHYRVNVFVGVDAASSKVAHSYFVVADTDGKLVASSPEIAREY